MSVQDPLFDAISRVLKGECVKDLWFDVDVPKSRVQVALACGKRGFALGAAECGDQVCFFADVAQDLRDGARVLLPLHVRFSISVVDRFAWWFASDLEGGDKVRRGGGSPESV